jgi:hypothetical protein
MQQYLTIKNITPEQQHFNNNNNNSMPGPLLSRVWFNVITGRIGGDEFTQCSFTSVLASLCSLMVYLQE